LLKTLFIIATSITQNCKQVNQLKMKQLKFKSLSLAVAVSMVFAACNPLNKMAKRASEVNYSVTPNPLEMHADSIQIEFKGSFPAKYFNKKVSAKVIPVLKYTGGEKEFDAITLSGELSEVDGTKINYEKGGSFTHSARIPYQEGMHKAELFLKVEGAYKSAKKELNSEKVADGTNITPKLVQNDDKPVLGKDNFQKIVPVNASAEINYLVNRHEVRSTELSQDDIKALKEFIKKGVKRQYVFKNLQVEAYASPDGEITLNENLANQRAESAARFVKGELSRNKVAAGKEETFYNKVGKGEDWDGFKSAMEASDIQDKNLILRVLEMYTDLNKREEEIKNLAATYVEVADRILPQLRRAQLTLNAEEKSKTDEQIARLAGAAPDSLTVEELLYAATLTEDMNKKLSIYQSVAKVFPSDWRGPNNVGYIYVMQNKLNEAKAEFEKAAKLNINNAAVNNNLGVIARLNGDVDKALDYYKSAEGSSPEVSQNLGLVHIIKGKYDEASSYYNTTKTFNASLAKLLNGQNDEAASILNETPDKDAAHTYYLKAIIEARASNNDAMISNLKSAIGKDAALKAKAKDDVEFIKFWNNSDFQAAVN
jgi:Flp pilus assembly protein TadD